MTQRLLAQFLVGFHEGWAMFWSPYVAFATRAKITWQSHVRQNARHR
jgi:hypothetical protein